MTEISVVRALFTADDKPDTEARVLFEPDGKISFSIVFDDTDKVLVPGLPEDRKLQLTEALQFVSDTIGVQVPGRLSPFARGWISTASDVHQNAKDKGFWEEGVDRNNGEMLALIHSEISEALEALRTGNPPDDKLPEFSSVEVELADAVIRIMDLAHARGWRVAQAVEAKARFNTIRSHKHGKEF